MTYLATLVNAKLISWSRPWFRSATKLNGLWFGLFWVLHRLGELQEVMTDISRKQCDQDCTSTQMGNFDRYEVKWCLMYSVTGTAVRFTSICFLEMEKPRPLTAMLLSYWTSCPLRLRPPRTCWWRSWVSGFMRVHTCWWWETRAWGKRLSSGSSTSCGNLLTVREEKFLQSQQEMFRKCMAFVFMRDSSQVPFGWTRVLGRGESCSCRRDPSWLTAPSENRWVPPDIEMDVKFIFYKRNTTLQDGLLRDSSKFGKKMIPVTLRHRTIAVVDYLPVTAWHRWCMHDLFILICLKVIFPLKDIYPVTGMIHLNFEFFCNNLVNKLYKYK